MPAVGKSLQIGYLLPQVPLPGCLSPSPGLIRPNRSSALGIIAPVTLGAK